MLMEGVRLMVVGMSTVFAFLAVMVALMAVTAALLRRLPEPAGAPQSAAGGGRDELVEVAIALAAIEARSRTRRS